MVSFTDRAATPAHVLVRFLDRESVLLNLETEQYFGLDETGTRMWQLVTASPNIDAAYQELLAEFDVEPELLRSNLMELLGRLVDSGLLQVLPLMWERLRRFSALERPARELFLRAVVLLPLVALSLRWRGFKATQAALQRFLSKANPESEAVLAGKDAAVTAHMVNAADRHGLVHPSCLAKIPDSVVAARAAGNSVAAAHRHSKRKRKI